MFLLLTKEKRSVKGGEKNMSAANMSAASVKPDRPLWARLGCARKGLIQMNTRLNENIAETYLL